MNGIKKLLFICALIFSVFSLSAQENIIEIEISVFPPYPVNLDYYLDFLGNGIFEVTNTTQDIQPVLFKATIVETSGLINISNDINMIDPVELPPGMSILNTQDIDQIFGNLNIDNVQTAGLTQDERDAIILNRQLPEGTYQLCLSAFDASGELLSDPTTSCVEFDAYFAERPIILDPFDGDFLELESPYSFNWLHDVNDPAVANRLEYTIKILDLTEDDIQNPEIAMLNPSVLPIFEQNLSNTTTVILDPVAELFLEDGHQYAMRIAASDPLDEIFLGFKAYSEIVIFNYGSEYNNFPAPEITNESDDDEEGEPFVFAWEEDDPAEGDTIIVDGVEEDEYGSFIFTWEHDIDDPEGLLTYTAFILEVPEDEELTIDSFILAEEYLWEGEDMQQAIIIAFDDVEFEPDTDYAMIIHAESDSEFDIIENDGYSEIFIFNYEESEESNEVIMPEIIRPKKTEKIDSSFTLVWEHDLDADEDSLLITTLSYEFKILDLTELKIPNVQVSHFIDTDTSRYYFTALDTTSKTVVIKPTGDDTLIKGHTYAISIVMQSNDEDFEFPDDGYYSNIVTFKTIPEPTIIDSFPLPLISTPVNGLTKRDSTIKLVWAHNLDPATDSLWIDSTEYKLQLIDLTAGNITTPKASHFMSASTPKLWNKNIISKDTTFVPAPVKLINEHTYAMVIKAIGTDSLKYSNNGYGNIIKFTRSDIFPLPIIEFPENNKVAALDSFRLKWDHVLGTSSIDSIGKVYTAYRFKMIDITETKAAIMPINFESDSIAKVYDTLITAKDTLIRVDSLVIGHQYIMAIQAISTDTSKFKSYTNYGCSNIIRKTHDNLVQDDGCPGSMCIAALPADQNAIELTDTLLTDTFLINNLKLEITLIESGDEEDGYNGTGIVTIGFMGNGTRIKVNLTGIKVNQAKQVFSGQADAMYDTNFAQLDNIVELLPNDSIATVDQEAARTFSAALRSAGKLTTALSGLSAVSLPLGFDRINGLDTTVIGITEMTFTPEQNDLEAIFTINNPDWGQYVPSLAADKICFNNDGFGNQVRLYLKDDYTIPLGGKRGDLILEATDPDDKTVMGTYVELNCNGFKEAQISASLAIDRSYLTPVDEDNEVIQDTSVKAKITFSGIIQKQNNFLLAANLTPCQLPRAEGFVLNVQNGYIDFSDKSNPPGLIFPDGYTPDEVGKLWRGVWFEEISLTLPEDFGGGAGDERTKIALNNFIFDKSGPSLEGSVDSVLRINKGNIEGCAISIDKFEIKVVKSQLKSLSLNGKLGLPILPEGKYLDYEGLIDIQEKLNIPGDSINKRPPASMSLIVKAPDAEYNIPSLRSTITLDESTQIILKRDSLERGIKATLTGAISLGEGDTSDQDSLAYQMFSIPAVKFEEMEFNLIKKFSDTTRLTRADIFKAPTLSLVGIPKFVHGDSTVVDPDIALAEESDTTVTPTIPKVNGFDFGLDVFSIESEESGADSTKLTITVGGHVGIVRTGGPGLELVAEGEVSIDCILDRSGGFYRLSYKELTAAKLGIQSEIGPIAVNGDFEFYNNDKVFGDGVLGEVSISAMETITVGVKARFGVKDIEPGDNDSDNQSVDGNNTNSDTNSESEDLGKYCYGYLFADFTYEPGQPLGSTGVNFHSLFGGFYMNMKLLEGQELNSEPSTKYIPKKGLLGFKAGFGLSLTKAEMVYGKLALDMEINYETGGINHVGLEGSLDMMQLEPFADKQGDEFEGIRLKSKLTILPPNQDRKYIEIKGDFLALANLQGGLIVGNRKAYGEYVPLSYEVVSGKLNIITGPEFIFDMNLGTMANPGSLKISIPGLEPPKQAAPVGGEGIEADITAKFYLQASVGKERDFEDFQVPGFISEILNRGSENSDPENNFVPMGGDPTVIQQNKQYDAFAMAAGLTVTAQANVNYAMVYGDFKAMLGFDASITSKIGVSCSNFPEDAKYGIGPENHYAEAQIFAGLDGRIGLDVDCFLYKGKVDLAHLYAALLLEGGFPSPFYAKGTAKMGFSALGGLVKGDVDLKMQLGEQCQEYQSNPLAGITFIDKIVPSKPTTVKQNVSPFVKPLVSFSNKIGPYSFEDDVQDLIYFDVRLKTFTITNSNTGAIVPSSVNQADDKLSAYIDPNTSLKANTKYNIDVVLEVYQKDNNTYEWVLKDTESKAVSFRTGEMPNYIPWNNVNDCYPFRGEEYYMIHNNYADQGLIKLENSQQALFEKYEPSDQKWHSKVVAKIKEKPALFWDAWDPKNWETISESDVMYNSENDILYYDMTQKSQLKLNQIYGLDIDRVWYENPNFDQSTSDLNDEVVDIANDVILTYTKKGKSYTNADEKRPSDTRLANYEFSTSDYRKFSDKMNGGKKTIQSQPFIKNYIYNVSNGEPLSDQEIGTRTIAESKTVNKNCAFIQEDINKLKGTFFAEKYYEVQILMLSLEQSYNISGSYAVSHRDMYFHRNYSLDFDSNNEGVVFDYDDMKARSLYLSYSTQNTKIYSNVNIIFPTQSDYKHFDFMMYKLVGQAHGSKYEDALWDYHEEELYDKYKPFWDNQMGAGVHRGWFKYAKHDDEFGRTHRIRDYRNHVETKSMITKPVTKLYYTYTIPYFNGQKLIYKTVDEGIYQFAKPY